MKKIVFFLGYILSPLLTNLVYAVDFNICLLEPVRLVDEHLGFNVKMGPISKYEDGLDLHVVESFSDFQSAGFLFSELTEKNGKCLTSRQYFQKRRVSVNPIWEIDTHPDHKRIMILNGYSGRAITVSNYDFIDNSILDTLSPDRKLLLLQTLLKKKKLSSAALELLVARILLSSGSDELYVLNGYLKRAEPDTEFLHRFPELRSFLKTYVKMEKKQDQKSYHIMTNPPEILREFESGYYEKTCQYLNLGDDGEVRESSSWQVWLEKWEFQYCIFTEKGSQSKDLIYYFHGLTSDASTWMGTQGLYEIRNRLRDRNDLPPVLSVSIGKLSWFSEKVCGVEGIQCQSDLFIQKFVPYMESKLESVPTRRLAIGVSLGGGDVLHFAERFPQFFQKVVSIGPAIGELTPFSSYGQILEYSRRSGGVLFWIAFSQAISRWHFNDPEFYNEVANTLKLAPETIGKHSPEIMICIGKNDELGLTEGVDQFEKIAIKNGARIRVIKTCENNVWPYANGGHCEIPSKLIGCFLGSKH